MGACRKKSCRRSRRTRVLVSASQQYSRREGEAAKCRARKLVSVRASFRRPPLDRLLHRPHFDFKRPRLAFEIAKRPRLVFGATGRYRLFYRARSVPLDHATSLYVKSRARLGFARPQQNFNPRMGMG